LGFFFSPLLFPMCSHYVPMRFSKGSTSCSSQWFPNSTSVLSHMVCPKFNPQVYKLKRCAIGAPFVSILWLGVQKRCIYWGVPNILRKLMMGQSIWLVQINQKKKEKSCEHTNELINMNVCYVPHNLFFSLVPNVFPSCSHEVMSKGSSQFPSCTWRRSQ
jgi:hypothetical protein